MSETHERGVSQPSGRKWWLLGLGSLMIASAVAVSAITLLPPQSDANVVTVQGVDVTTNQVIEESNGRVYVLIPVNTEVADVIFESEYPQDTYDFHSFLEGLDTLIPGEYAVKLSTGEVRVIVDGIADQQ